MTMRRPSIIRQLTTDYLTTDYCAGEAIMTKWWIGAAVAAILWGQTAAVRAQPPAAPAGLVPEPAPVAPCPPQLPPAVPGPLTPGMAPPGPPNDLSLPATVPTAWQQGPVPESGFFLSAGAMALRRQRPEQKAVFVSADNTTDLDTGFRPIGLRGVTPLLNFNQIIPDFSWGVRGTVGYLYDNAGLEVTGFYLPGTDDSISVANPGRLTLLFDNPPLGLEGDNGLWLQADFTQATLNAVFGSVEMNYRWWALSITGFEGILGVRYVDYNEKLSIFTDDDGILIRDINGLPDPLRQATYLSRAHNHILAPQLGAEWFYPLCSWLSVGAMAKGAWGVNYIDVNTRVKRGDDYVGREGRRSDVTFSHLYEINGFFDLVMFDRMRLRAGYNVMWLVGVAEAIDQISYDLRVQPGPAQNSGSIFFHGPMVELQLLF
jgi:hypothetical protein